MDAELRYRGRLIRTDDVASIQSLIAANPRISRRALSHRVCDEWGWYQSNGAMRDAVCRGMLLWLHRGGYIELPEPRWRAKRAAQRNRKPTLPDIDTTPLRCRLSDLGKLRFEQVRRTNDEALFDGLIEAHHYLGFTRPVGEHLKVLVRAGERPVVCFVWSSAPRHLRPRDGFIGWTAEQRRRNIELVAYNSRFLILPWVSVPHLASHVLAQITRLLPRCWQEAYGHPVWFAETFVDPTRFRGTCYRAANWIALGRTTGRGKDDQTGRPNRSLKDVLGLPLNRRFRALLTRIP